MFVQSIRLDFVQLLVNKQKYVKYNVIKNNDAETSN